MPHRDAISSRGTRAGRPVIFTPTMLLRTPPLPKWSRRGIARAAQIAAFTLLVAACDSGSAPPPASEGAGGARLDRPVVLPAATLTDQHGEPFDLRADTPGRVTLLFFGYTNCPDICPVHMANLAAVMRELPLEVTRDVDVVFVTTDPDRDTPERLDEWLGRLHPRFIGLWGSREEIAALELAVGIPGSVVAPDTPAPGGGYFVGHAAQVLAFGPDNVARMAYPWGTRQRDWIRDLPRLVRGDWPEPNPSDPTSES